LMRENPQLRNLTPTFYLEIYLYILTFRSITRKRYEFGLKLNRRMTWHEVIE
jgi:hypothetical protein